eukprot:2141444-Pyramimonas_sp.AAC.1
MTQSSHRTLRGARRRDTVIAPPPLVRPRSQGMPRKLSVGARAMSLRHLIERAALLHGNTVPISYQVATPLGGFRCAGRGVDPLEARLHNHPAGQLSQRARDGAAAHPNAR